MKRIITSILLFLAVTVAYSEPRESRKVIYCDELPNVVKELVQNHDEKPIWIGQSPYQQTTIAIFQNNKNGSWTIVEYRGNLGCVIGVGIEGKLTDKDTI